MASKQTPDAENTAGRQRGRPFKPGQSGNPAGRPKGTRNKTTLAVEELLDGEADALTRVCIEKAKGGDMAALRLCMDRIYPPRKERPVTFEIPKMESADDAVAVMGAVLEAVASGEVTAGEAQAIAGVIETFRRTLETSEIEKRLAALEGQKA